MNGIKKKMVAIFTVPLENIHIAQMSLENISAALLTKR